MGNFIKQFKIATLILIRTVLILIYAISKTVPQIVTIFKTKKECKAVLVSIEEKQRTIDILKEQVQRAKAQKPEVKFVKAFYIPVESGMDKEAVIAGEFTDVLKIMREYSIKARSVNYDYTPSDDNFYKYASSEYNVAEIQMDMIANYTQFKNFLIEIFKHEHFINIVSIEIQPYSKNKKILLIRFTMRLYGKTSSEV